MYYPEGMKARVSPVQSIEPHRILAPTRDSNPGPPGPESKVVTTIYKHPTFTFVLCVTFDRSSLTTEACKTIATAIVGSRLDYCNSLLVGTSTSNLARLQLVQNTLARVVTQKSRFSHISPVLSDLHWLPIRHRISFKLATSYHFQSIAVSSAVLPRCPYSTLYTVAFTPIIFLFNNMCTNTQDYYGEVEILFIRCFWFLE